MHSNNNSSYRKFIFVLKTHRNSSIDWCNTQYVFILLCFSFRFCSVQIRFQLFVFSFLFWIVQVFISMAHKFEEQFICVCVNDKNMWFLHNSVISFLGNSVLVFFRLFFFVFSYIGVDGHSSILNLDSLKWCWNLSCGPVIIGA